ncbi:hypothetical protein Efla_000142 [Eimeria flavescens]
MHTHLPIVCTDTNRKGGRDTKPRRSTLGIRSVRDRAQARARGAQRLHCDSRGPLLGTTPAPKSAAGAAAGRRLSAVFKLLPNPRMQWRPSLAASPLVFELQQGMLCMRFADTVSRVVLPVSSAAVRCMLISFAYVQAILALPEGCPAHRSLLVAAPSPRISASLRACSLCLAYLDSPTRWIWFDLPLRTLFERVVMDIFRPLPQAKSGSTHIVALSIITRAGSRWSRFVTPQHLWSPTPFPVHGSAAGWCPAPLSPTTAALYSRTLQAALLHV